RRHRSTAAATTRAAASTARRVTIGATSRRRWPLLLPQITSFLPGTVKTSGPALGLAAGALLPGSRLEPVLAPGFHLGGLFGDVADGLAEFPDALAQRLADLGQPPRSEDDQGDAGNQDQFPEA